MRALLALLLISALFSASPAHAQTAQSCQGSTITPGSNATLLCSKTLYASGSCSGGDDVALMQTPWEPSSITIRAVSINAYVAGANPQRAYIFAGNSYNPDVMTPIAFGVGSGNGVMALNSQMTYPAGSGMQFPGSSYSPAPHVDAHIWCLPAGSGYQVYETIWYTVP